MRFGRIPKREKQRLLDEMQSYMIIKNSMDTDTATPSEAPPIETSPSAPWHQSGSDGVVRGSSYVPVVVKEEQKPVEINEHNNNDESTTPDLSPSRESQLRSVSPHITSTTRCPAQGRVSHAHTENTPTPTGSDIKQETPCFWRSGAGAKVLVCK